MPLPKPHNGEGRQDFISRCVGDDAIQQEAQSTAQAVAICANIYDRERSMNGQNSANELLLKAIKARDTKRESFGYGIITADKYVRTLLEAVGSDTCYRAAASKQTSFDDVLRKAAKTLVYSHEGMIVENKQTGAFHLDKAPEGTSLPKNTLMVLKHWVTTPRRDRDGDILRSEGMTLDPKMLMLWQHVHTLPIGKYLYTTHHSQKGVQVVSAIIDMGEVAHDAAVMADNDMLRFSHGFRATTWEPLKGENGEEMEYGFDIKEGEIMEESGVSVPSNVDAEVEDVMLSLIEGGKLTSCIMKEYGRHLRDVRPLVAGIRYQERCGDYTRSIEAPNAAVFEQIFSTLGTNNANQPIGSGEGEGEKGVRTEPNATSEEADDQGAKDAEASTSEKMTSTKMAKLHAAGKSHANSLIKSGKVSRPDSWNPPSAEAENKYIEENGLSAFGKWHMGVDPDANEDTKGRYKFIFTSDFKTVDRQGIVAVRTRGAQAGYDDISNAARSLLDEIDKDKEAIVAEKTGRALSKANENSIREAIANIDECLSMELPRAAKAMLREATGGLSQVLESLSHEEGDGKAISVEVAMVVVLHKGTMEQKQRLLLILSEMKSQEDRGSRIEQYRTYVGASATGGGR